MPKTARNDEELPNLNKVTLPPSLQDIGRATDAAERAGGGLAPSPHCLSENLIFRTPGGEYLTSHSCACGRPLVLALSYETEEGYRNYAQVCMRCDDAIDFPVLN